MPDGSYLSTTPADRYRLELEFGAGGMAGEGRRKPPLGPLSLKRRVSRVGLPADCRAASVLADSRDD